MCVCVCRFHSWPALQHRRSGLPSVCVRSLADPAGWPQRPRVQTLPGRGRHTQTQGPEGGHSRTRQLPRQIIKRPVTRLRSVARPRCFTLIPALASSLRVQPRDTSNTFTTFWQEIQVDYVNLKLNKNGKLSARLCAVLHWQSMQMMSCVSKAHDILGF